MIQVAKVKNPTLDQAFTTCAVFVLNEFQNDVDTSTDLISLRADQAFVALTPSLANGQGIVADWIVAKGGPGGPQFFFWACYNGIT